MRVSGMPNGRGPSLLIHQEVANFSNCEEKPIQQSTLHICKKFLNFRV